MGQVDIGNFHGEQRIDGLVIGYDYNQQQWIDTSPACPVCAGESYPLGKLGSRVHYCCRACGMEFSEAQT